MPHVRLSRFRGASVLFFLGLAMLASPASWADIAADPIALDLGDVAMVRLSRLADAPDLRFFVEAPIVVRNTGSGSVEILDVEITPPSPFALRPAACRVLPPGGACTLRVRYAPLEAGSHAAALEIRASDGEVLVVPLWGDAVEVVCEGSTCEGPPLSFGPGGPGRVAERIVGFANGTGGEVLAGAELAEPDGFEADFDPPGILPPGSEYDGVITHAFAGEPGVRRAASVWNFPPPMLPVIRSIRIPLTASVVHAFDPVASSPLPAGFRATGRLRARTLPCRRRAQEARLMLVPGEMGLRPRVAVSRVRRVGSDAPTFEPWTLLPIDTDDPIIASVPLIVPRPKGPSDAGSTLARRRKRYALALTRKEAVLLDASKKKPVIIARTASLLPLEPIIARSRLRKGRVYAVRRKAAEEGAGRQIAAIRLRWLGGDRILEGPAIALRARDVPSVLERRATRVGALAPVPVRRSDGTWREALVAVVRYRTKDSIDGGAGVRRLLLLGDGGGRLEARARLSAEAGRVLGLAARRAAGPDAAIGAEEGPAIRAYVARRGGRILRWRAAARRPAGADRPAWQWRRIGRRKLGHEAHRLLPRMDGRPKNPPLSLFAIGRRETSLLASSSRGMRRMRRASLGRGRRVRSASLPRRACTGDPPLYLLRRDAGGGALVTAYSGEESATHRPTAYTGDLLYLARADPGEKGAWLTLEAIASDPDGDPIHYSWTAPGIAFDDPTAPAPRGFFPIGETTVYLVVRDRSPDDPEALESAPCIARVRVLAAGGIAAGDANGDGRLDIGDAVSILLYLFAGAPAVVPLEVLDTNGDGKTDIADAVYLLAYLFTGGPPPVGSGGA